VRLIARWLYAAAANLTTAAARWIPPGDSKTVIAMRARSGLQRRYTAWSSESRGSEPLLWMHAPSVGEGLQARPVLALMRARHPKTKLAYTFFSPSAEEFTRGLDVDFRDYLPFDSASATGAALNALRPTAVVFSKVDVWPEFVRQAALRGVRLGMISATLPEGSSRRGGLAALLLRDAYAALDAVGAVDDADASRLTELGVRAQVISVTGDTRYDQVWDRAGTVNRDSLLLKRFASDRPTIVAGSTWPSDANHLLPAFEHLRNKHAGLRLIIAPHETGPEYVEPLAHVAAQRGARVTRIDHPDAASADVVIVDRFGLLGDLYALASVAFVGGGFHDAGLHSVLEPAAFGAPVVFGPRHHRSRDAALLIAAGGARSCRDAADIQSALGEWLAESSRRNDAGGKAAGFVKRGRGAAERSLAIVEQLMKSS
jgi:3-deoxy-D-manno-octulosonic-acid transferase